MPQQWGTSVRGGIVGQSIRRIEQTNLVIQSVTTLPSDHTTEDNLRVRYGLASTRRPASYLLLKRTIDVLGASIGLLLLLPVLGVIACAVAVSSPGRVLFSQKRYGFGQRLFRIYKFRT